MRIHKQEEHKAHNQGLCNQYGAAQQRCCLNALAVLIANPYQPATFPGLFIKEPS